MARNTVVRELPTRPVLDVYSGPLHEGLDAASLSPEARARADDRLVVASSLWGALRPVDRIPPYRLHICSHLYGMDRLEPTWRTVLPGVLAEAAGDRGLVVDLRSPGYQAIGMPAGLAERTVTLRIEQRTAGGRIGDVVAKRMRGQAAQAPARGGRRSRRPGGAGRDPRRAMAGRARVAGPARRHAPPDAVRDGLSFRGLPSRLLWIPVVLCFP